MLLLPVCLAEEKSPGSGRVGWGCRQRGGSWQPPAVVAQILMCCKNFVYNAVDLTYSIESKHEPQMANHIT